MQHAVAFDSPLQRSGDWSGGRARCCATVMPGSQRGGREAARCTYALQLFCACLFLLAAVFLRFSSHPILASARGLPALWLATRTRRKRREKRLTVPPSPKARLVFSIFAV